MCMAFLSTLRNQGADGNKNTPPSNMVAPSADNKPPSNMAGRSTDNCVCYGPNGKTYNLAPLQRDDGKPRFLNISYLAILDSLLLFT